MQLLLAYYDGVLTTASAGFIIAAWYTVIDSFSY